MKTRLILLVLLFFIMSCQDRLDKNISSNFIGTWTLIKCIAIRQDGKITFPYGETTLLLRFAGSVFAVIILTLTV
jgi:hypothetical protein